MQLESETSGLVGKILVKPGDHVSAGQAVCSIKLCPHLEEIFNGTCSTCGQEVEEADDNSQHPVRGRGVERSEEARTGVMMRGATGAGKVEDGFFGGVACPRLKMSKEGAIKQQNQRVKEMLAAKKLALVLDLDHTLLHTAHASSEWQHDVMVRTMNLSRDVKYVMCKGTGHSVVHAQML